jgi:zinc protease
VRKYLKPENMIVVAVGDKKKIEPDLEKLNLGPIEELDFEANPIKK